MCCIIFYKINIFSEEDCSQLESIDTSTELSPFVYLDYDPTLNSIDKYIEDLKEQGAVINKKPVSNETGELTEEELRYNPTDSIKSNIAKLARKPESIELTEDLIQTPRQETIDKFKEKFFASTE